MQILKKFISDMSLLRKLLEEALSQNERVNQASRSMGYKGDPTQRGAKGTFRMTKEAPR